MQDINLWGETPNLTKEPIKFAPDIRRVKIDADAHISSTETFVHASLDAPEFYFKLYSLYDGIITYIVYVMIMRSKSRYFAFTEATATEMVMPTTFLRALTTPMGCL